MAEYGKRRHGNAYELFRLGAAFIGLLLLFGVAVVSVRAAWGMYGKFAEARAGSVMAQSELETLRQKEEQVRASVATFSSERGIEEEVRARFGVARKGEGEIQIVRDAAGVGEFEAMRPSLWERIRKIFSSW